MAKLGDIDDYLQNHLDGIVDLNNPECVKCNECCSMGTMLTPKEYAQLKKFLSHDNKGKQVFQRGISLLKRHLANNTIYWLCPFSNNNKRCEIYNIRPEICRQFHCKDELRSKNYNKDLEKQEHYCIFDLFKHGVKLT